MADSTASPQRLFGSGLGWALMSAVVLLSACALAPLPPETPPQAAPDRWHTPSTAGVSSQAATGLPHQGSLDELLNWWRQQGDPLLVELIIASQQVSPSVARPEGGS